MHRQQREQIRKVLEDRLTMYTHWEGFRGGVCMCPDEAEYATRLCEQALAAAMQGRAARAVRSIEQALSRIDDPRFGICSGCAEPIGLARLKARPDAVLCFECQSALEN